MFNVAITPQLRALGWNVHILCGPDSDRFAGIFHPPGSNSLTYRDIVDELRLCFDIPTDSKADDGESANPWQDNRVWIRRVYWRQPTAARRRCLNNLKYIPTNDLGSTSGRIHLFTTGRTSRQIPDDRR
ncbi:hypothetical protein J3459_018198 [Metarhizium acridum]|nr:hypothetical protein J3459_018198 [Metarhizium acridum]